MASSPPPCRAHGSPGRGARRPALQPLDDPFAMELVLVPARGVERWLSQRLSHLLGRGAGGGRGLRGGRVPQPALADRRDHGHRRRRPVGARRHGVAAARGDRRVPRRALVPDAWPPTSATSTPARSASCARAGATPWPDASPDSSRPTPGNGRSCSPDWLDGETTGLDADLDWQPPLWRALAERMRRRPAPRQAARNRLRAFVTRRSTCRAAVAVRAHPAARPPRSSSSAHSATHHDVHLWLPHPSDDAVATRSPISHGAVPRRDDTSHRAVHHPLLATLGRDLRELQRSLPSGSAHRRVPRRARAPGDAARLAAVRRRRQCRSAAAAGRLAERDRLGAGARLPRPGPAGRGAARGAARPARRRPDAGAARHPGDVPRRRDLRAADRRRLRPRRRAARRAPRPTGCGCGSPTARWRRPTRCSASRRSCSTLAGGRVDRERGARPRAGRARCARRFGFTDDNLEDVTRWVAPGRTSAGASTRSTGEPYGLPTSCTTPGVSASTGSSRASPCPTTRTRWIGSTLPLDDVGSNRRRPRRPARRVRRPARSGPSTRSTGDHPLDALAATRSADGHRRR